ncbi:MAG: DUF4124 domain-containing protein [Rhodanobacteraceae bacterium]
MKSTALLLVLMIAPAGVCAEEVYAWTDATGVKHFSDSPPPADVHNARRLTLHGGTAATTSAPASSGTSSETDTGADVTDAATAGQAPGSSADSQAKACETARNNLKLLQSNYQISMPNGADGKPQVIDKGRRDLEIARAKDQISFYCK